jgi:hypothetical protein
MANVTDKLNKLRNGQSATVSGKKVRREEDTFIIDGRSFELSEAIVQLADPDDHANRAYGLAKPYCGIHRVVRVRSAGEYQAMLTQAKRERLYLFTATIRREPDRKPFVTGPWIVDWNSIPDKPYGSEDTDQESKELACPHCDRKFRSSSGLTLHINGKHQRQ